MKPSIYTTLLIVLLACNSKESNTQTATESDSLNNFIIDTTLIKEGLNIDIPLPNGIALDSLKEYDKNRNLQVLMYFTKSNESLLDSAILKILNKPKNEFVKTIDNIMEEDGELYISAMTSEFIIVPISVFKNESMISQSFEVSHYLAGAPHPVTKFSSFNYDYHLQQKVEFSDYFIIDNKADSSFIMEIITKAINREGINVNSLNNIDFNIEIDTISFNFGDYEIASYAEGLIQARIPKDDLLNKIEKKYR